MTRILLVRHGETDYNNERRFLGYSDVAMSPVGEQQVQSLRDYIAHESIDAIYASDLKRTVKTAEILRGERNLPIDPCPELREMNYGSCEGMTIEQIDDHFPDVAAHCRLFTPELEFPRGETFHDFNARVITFAEKLEHHKAADTVLVVSHNGPLRVLILHFLVLAPEHWWQFHVDIASLSVIELRPRGGILVSLNDVPFSRRPGR